MLAAKNNTGMMKMFFTDVSRQCSADIPLFIKKSKRIHTQTGVFENIAIVVVMCCLFFAVRRALRVSEYGPAEELQPRHINDSRQTTWRQSPDALLQRSHVIICKQSIVLRVANK
jgi:hypothetical protein